MFTKMGTMTPDRMLKEKEEWMAVQQFVKSVIKVKELEQRR